MNRANWRDVSSLLHLANNCCLELPARPDHGISKCSCHMLCASAPSHTMTYGILQIYVPLRLALGWVRWLVTGYNRCYYTPCFCQSYKPEPILTLIPRPIEALSNEFALKVPRDKVSARALCRILHPGCWDVSFSKGSTIGDTKNSWLVVSNMFDFAP